MANFTFNANAGLTTSDGVSLARIATGVGANAKALLDDTFGAGGPVSIDFAPLIVSIANPLWFMFNAGGDGAKLKFDGVATFTAKAYKMLLAAITPNTPGPSGVLDLEVETNGAIGQRIQFLCVGDPD